jgi:hypothetical protein
MSTALSRVAAGVGAFFRFWYGFIVGDDWTVAAAVGAALLITAALNKRGLIAWWLLPLTVATSTAISLWTKRASAQATSAGATGNSAATRRGSTLG